MGCVVFFSKQNVHLSYMESWMLVFLVKVLICPRRKNPKNEFQNQTPPSGFDSFKRGISPLEKYSDMVFFSTICSNLKRFCVFSCFGWRTPHTLTKKDNAKIFSVNLFLSSKFHLLTPHFLFFQLADLQLLLMLLDQGSKKLTKLRYLDGWKDH